MVNNYDGLKDELWSVLMPSWNIPIIINRNIHGKESEFESQADFWALDWQLDWVTTDRGEVRIHRRSSPVYIHYLICGHGGLNRNQTAVHGGFEANTGSELFGHGFWIEDVSHFCQDRWGHLSENVVVCVIDLIFHQKDFLTHIREKADILTCGREWDFYPITILESLGQLSKLCIIERTWSKNCSENFWVHVCEVQALHKTGRSPHH